MNDPKYQTGDPPAASDLSDDSIIISSDTLRENRVPPGQSRTKKWPVLDAHGTPIFDTDQWELKIFGLVETEVSLNRDQFSALPRVQVFSDFHCVTKWSRLGNLWEGVSTKTILDLVTVSPDAKFAILHGYDHGWTTNLPLEDFLSDDALLADLHDGVPIDADHGGPIRGMVPKLYAWKSAKWIKGIELAATDKPGYWERGGYHNHGDPWTEERFG